MRFYFLFFLFFLIMVPSALAHCPLCTATTGVAVAATRWYGLDDSLVGVFVGGLIVTTGLWANNMINRYNKGKEFLPLQSTIVLIVSFILTTATLYFANLVGPANPYKIFGIDRILFGALIGIVVSIASFEVHRVFRTVNGDKNYLPYQSILFLASFLSISSLVLYLVM